MVLFVSRARPLRVARSRCIWNGERNEKKTVRKTLIDLESTASGNRNIRDPMPEKESKRGQIILSLIRDSSENPTRYLLEFISKHFLADSLQYVLRYTSFMIIFRNFIRMEFWYLFKISFGYCTADTFRS